METKNRTSFLKHSLWHWFVFRLANCRTQLNQLLNDRNHTEKKSENLSDVTAGVAQMDFVCYGLFITYYSGIYCSINFLDGSFFFSLNELTAKKHGIKRSCFMHLYRSRHTAIQRAKRHWTPSASKTETRM